MGGKLTKSKPGIVSEKTNDSQKTLSTTAEATNDPVDVTIVTITNDKQKIEKTKTKKKKEEKCSKKLAKVRVDKSTNTDNYFLTSSPYKEHLVGGDEIPALIPNITTETSTAQINVAYQSETLPKDVQELREQVRRNDTMPFEFVNEHSVIFNAQIQPVVSSDDRGSSTITLDAPTLPNSNP